MGPESRSDQTLQRIHSSKRLNHFCNLGRAALAVLGLNTGLAIPALADGGNIQILRHRESMVWDNSCTLDVEAYPLTGEEIDTTRVLSNGDRLFHNLKVLKGGPGIVLFDELDEQIGPDPHPNPRFIRQRMWAYVPGKPGPYLIIDHEFNLNGTDKGTPTMISGCALFPQSVVR